MVRLTDSRSLSLRALQLEAVSAVFARLRWADYRGRCCRRPHIVGEAPREKKQQDCMAERVGFEPTVEFPQHSLSRRALSTAQTPLRGRYILAQPSIDCIRVRLYLQPAQRDDAQRLD